MSKPASHLNSLSLWQNFRNLLLAGIVSVPALLFHHQFQSNVSAQERVLDRTLSVKEFFEPVFKSDLAQCLEKFNALALYHPIAFVSLFFFFNVNVLFWLVSLVQSSTWLIDPYWTIIPFFINHFYSTHPLSSANKTRSWAVTILVWLWSFRLTHSYFRREKWQWGAREDWRFYDLRRSLSTHWWWTSFFIVYVSQELFLVGISLPFWAVHFSAAPLNIFDVLATMVCLMGILIGYFADTQLHNFVAHRSSDPASKRDIVLKSGLWGYSRHPNYFGEQLFWWGVSVFGWNVGHSWTVSGTVVNSLCLAYVTVLVEKRMLKDAWRTKEYLKYQRETSVLVPWFRSVETKGE